MDGGDIDDAAGELGVTESADEGLGKKEGALEAGDVGPDENSFAACRDNLLFGDLSLVQMVAVVDDAICAFLCEAFGDGLADA